MSEALSFDASRFLELLLSSPELGEQLRTARERQQKVVFIVPGRDTKWMADAGALSESFPNICFFEAPSDASNAPNAHEATSPRQMRLVSMANMAASVDSEGGMVALFKDSAADGKASSTGQQQLLEGEAAEGSTFKIEATFSVDTEDLDAQVCVIDSDQIQTPLAGSNGDSVAEHPAPSLESFMGEDAYAGPGTADSSRQDGNGEEFWRQTLLIKLRDPFAAPVVKEIKRVLRLLAKDSLAAEERSLAVQQFYEDLRGMLADNPVWDGASREELEGAIEAVEKYVFTKCYDFVYQPADSDDAVQDRLFAEKAAKLESSITFAGLCDGGDAIAVPQMDDYGEALRALGRVYQVEAPAKKLEALTAFVKGAMERNEDCSADLLIPVLVWCVLKNIPNSLISDVRYIQRFRNHNKLTGEAAYCLTNVIAIITTIEKLHAEQVAKTKPIYSMLAASQEHLPVQPSKPAADFTSSFINTIGFVPRAIGSAVVDTFRSRSTRASITREALSPPEGARATEASAAASPVMTVDPKVQRVREKVRSVENVDELSLREIQLVLQDYKDVLARTNAL